MSTGASDYWLFVQPFRYQAWFSLPIHFYTAAWRRDLSQATSTTSPRTPKQTKNLKLILCKIAQSQTLGSVLGCAWQRLHCKWGHVWSCMLNMLSEIGGDEGRTKSTKALPMGAQGYHCLCSHTSYVVNTGKWFALVCHRRLMLWYRLMIYLKAFLQQPPRSLPQHLSLAVSLVEFPGFWSGFSCLWSKKMATRTWERVWARLPADHRASLAICHRNPWIPF